MKTLKDKQDVFRTLKKILEFYDCYRVILGNNRKIAVEKTLETYNDFYEWLKA